ncbi:MAG: hypothetical protein N2595_05460 [bacterium]|nr:hypothetical protein [bacterium]
MNTRSVVTKAVDSGSTPPRPELAEQVLQHRRVSALIREAYAPHFPPSHEPPALAFLAQRVLARAHAQPPPPLARTWLALRTFFIHRPAYAWASTFALSALLLPLLFLPAFRSHRPPPAPVRSFVIYQLPDGSAFIRTLDYEPVSSQESSHDRS